MMRLKLPTILLTMGLFSFFGSSRATDPSQPPKVVQVAIDLSDKGDYDGAVKLLSQAIAADPRNAQAYFERGVALLNLERAVDAVKDFDQALAINPDFPGALDWRASAATSLGDHQGAAEDRFKALRAHPEGPHQGMGVSPQQWADCAESFINAGNDPRAREVLEDYFTNYTGKVSSYASYETAPMRMFARLLIRSGDFTRACAFAAKAYENKHKCPADVLVYAQALEASGNLVSARRICAEAMQTNNQMPGVKELSERLSK